MRSSRKAIVITVLLALVLLMVMTVPAMAGTAQKSPQPTFGTSQDWTDLTPAQLGAKEKAVRAYAAKYGAAATIPKLVGQPLSPAHVGMQFQVDISDNDPDHAGTYTEDFIVVGVGTHGIMCITQDAYDAFDGTSYHFANPYGDGSDLWMRTEDLLTPAQLTYMLDAFDNDIYPTEASTFGTPLARGADGQKVWMLLFNIRDEAYYDATAESYIAGYFSSSEDADNNKNMIHIDTYDWVDRIGPDSARPYLYEGVFAHEYQHLLHADADPDEESWVDEGMADLAAFMCGFMEDQGHVIKYIQYHPYIGLTFFGGNLADYGSAYLFQLYLWENYGKDAFTSAVFHNTNNGIQGIQDKLNTFGHGVAFDKVYDNWTLANYFDTMGPSAYGYQNLDIGPDTDDWTIQYMLDNFYNPWSLYPYDKFGLTVNQPDTIVGSWFYWDYFGYGAPFLPYTAHYYYFEPSNTFQAKFKGDSVSGIPAYAGSNQMISGTGAWTWRSFYRQVAVPGTGDSSLSFATWYHMEDDWDYFYVEVHDNTTDQWYTLPLTDGVDTWTTTSDEQEQDNPNVPAGREPKDYEAAGRWNALTGASSGWLELSTSLNQFQGHTITIYFRTWQDGAFTYEGALVDAVEVDLGGAATLDGFETGMGLWATPAAGDVAGWSRGTGLADNNWQATLVYMAKKTAANWKTAPNLYGQLTFATVKTYPTTMNAATDSGTIKGPRPSSFKTTPQWLYIVSNRTPGMLRADYMMATKK
jgi:hypothetical protein